MHSLLSNERGHYQQVGQSSLARHTEGRSRQRERRIYILPADIQELESGLFRVNPLRKYPMNEEGLSRQRARTPRGMATEEREEGKMRTGQATGACRQRLSASNFLSGLSPSASRAFELIKVTTTYPAGAILFVEGGEPRGVFVLSSGRAKLSICSASGKTMILRISGPGEILGLHAAVSNTGLQATAETIEPCQVSFVRSDEFLRLLREYPEASLEAARQLSASYQEACEQLRAIGLCDSARKRVARFVLEWVENGEVRDEGVRAILTLTHEEIGQLIGTSRETITRALGDFRSRNWIAVKGTSLLVKNIRALKELVGGDTRSSWAAAASQAKGAVRLYLNTNPGRLAGESYP